MPKISVIIPCYNVEQYISECLDSVLKQTFKDFEVICVEDCSTDKTKDILQKYAKKHKNIHIICNKINQKQGISRNKGIDASNSEYIYFLDSDDHLSQDCLEILYKKITKDKSDLVIGGIKPYLENKNDGFCINRCKFLENYLDFKPFKKVKITEKNSKEYYLKINVCPVNRLYKKSFLIYNNIYFINKICFYEDNGFWLKILACNPVISGIKNKTYFYRIRCDSTMNKMSSDKKAHLKNMKDVLKDALKFVKNKKHEALATVVFYKIYALKKHRLFYFVWNKLEMRLKILCFTIFGLLYNPSTKMYKLRLFGIPVYKWRIK